MATAIQTVPLKTITGQDATLGDHAGKVLLAVNVASKCGLTPQYAALEAVHNRYKDRGFAVLGFPANNFGAQEPGSDAEITEFCTTNFGVDFPMFSKISVKGDDQHPLYQKLTAEKPTKTYKDDSFKKKLAGYGIDTGREDEVTWNFEKFLIAKDGTVAGRFAPDIAPDDAIITSAIEAELAK
ncbi:glutathione peroxidase [Rhizorhabdus dicambivorans]|uniref:Glutathione peroxidase n=1 Tax=Rhizorhabdus dicambivorans TaxID=1850238 RepID=A0A2A4FU99_9SPHN|nr:glutathione peroxidase [Rhizorhabdus dicambivorans]ATE64780.1 glutathione peroxidase [Rhizorhabdus dicambivorans]PCE41276.1 glutathione peroxidase [Rhizorhabdus dicambivorans]